MTTSRARAVGAALLAATALAGWVLAQGGDPRDLRSSPSTRQRVGASPAIPGGEDAGVADAGPTWVLSPETRWLGVGGGAEPESTQVSLEQDLALAREVLGADGAILFAGGPTHPSVQVLDREPRGDPLRQALARLFDPRPGRGTHYRPPELPVNAPATVQNTLDVVQELVDLDRAPLLLYVVGHGEGGERPDEALVHLWGGWPLTVPALAESLDAGGGARVVRVVMTTCYGGGFAELAFRGADPALGPAATPRCGLFATPWNDEASGCDPNPERATQEGYGLHFLQALAGRDRAGRVLPRSTLDLDGDGLVSLLEAHSRVRMASRSIDVPTTTSERWLRAVAPVVGPEAPIALPEEEAVIATLSEELGLADGAAAGARLLAIEQALDEQADRLDGAQGELDDAYFALRIALLARWPVLDDPWHPDFESSLLHGRSSIAALLSSSPRALAHAEAEAELERLEDRYARLRIERARVARLVRAYETRSLARRLAHVGGSDLTYYEALLACERGQP